MKNKKKSLFVISSLACLALGVTAGAMMGFNGINKTARANNPSDTYTLYFDATTNAFDGSSNKTVATTSDGNTVSFSYINFVESAGNWAKSVDTKVASFYNAYDNDTTYHNALSGLLSVKVNYTGAQVYLDYGWGEDYKAEALSYSRKGVKLTSDIVFSFASVLESPEYLNIRTSNTETEINSITLTYSCSEGDYRDVYSISSKEELLGFKHLVESGASATPAVLTADIDLTGIEFEPIGNSANLFHAVFDGNNHKISNMTISSACTTNYVGLFYAIGSGTTVKDLFLENVNIDVPSTATRVGALAGYCNGNKSVIDNVMVSGTITSAASGGTGAIFGHGEGAAEGNTIKNCVNKATITSTVSTSLVGGMVGAIAEGITNPHHLTISNCVNYGELNGASYVGGIVGLIRTVKADAGVHTVVEYCENYGNILGTNSSVGGIVGRFRSGEVNNCRVGGKVTIKTYTKIDSLNTVGTTPEVMGTANVGAVCGAAETVSGSHVPSYTGLIACWAGGTGSNKFTSGTGTEADPYIITRAYQYFWLRKQTNDNNETFAGKYIALGNDIDFDYIEDSEYACNTNIATLAGAAVATTFSGTLDGQGHTINNMHVSRTGVAAMFGEPKNATFKNINFAGCSFTTGGQRAGHVAARAENCTFENINVLDGSVSGQKQIGGIAGFALGTTSFTNCTSGATVTMNTGDTATSSSVGGIVASTHNTAEHVTITGCEFTGVINGTGYAGGIIGLSDINTSGELIITECENSGTINSSQGEGTGGILGRVNSVGPVRISTCVNFGTVNKTAGLGTGGIVGVSVNNADLYIDACVNYGEVHGLTFVGGIMGLVRVSTNTFIMNCLNVGDIYATQTVNSSFIVGCNRAMITCCEVSKTAKAYVGESFVLASSLPAPLTEDSNVRSFVYGQQTDGGLSIDCLLVDID